VLVKVTGVLVGIERWEEDRTRILAAMQDTLVTTLNRQTETFDKLLRESMEANRSQFELSRRERDEIRKRLPRRAGDE